MKQTEGPLQIISAHQQSTPVDIMAIARDLGLTVHAAELERGVQGMLSRRFGGGPSGFAIFVNSFDAPVRQRFTVAHEIAHYVLHKDLINVEIVDKDMYRSSLTSEYESQANRLAADILMPSDLVRKEYNSNPNAAALAKIFDVSTAAMEIRLNSLRLQS